MSDDNTDALQRATRGRPPRIAEIATERRRRVPGSLDRSHHFKLGITPEIAAATAGYHLHWANDEGNRIHSLTVLDDYSPVEGVEPVPVGTSADGKPIYARLLKIPQQYYDEIQAERREQTNQLERGLIPKGNAQQPAQDGMYNDGSSIKRG